MQDAKQADPLDEVAQAIARHPRLTPSVLVYVGKMVKWRRSLGRFAWATASYVGTHVVGFVLVLHYANATGNPDNGATFTRLLDLCQRRNVCGSRALRTVLTLSTLAGYLRTERGSDGRIQVFMPTDKLIVKSQDIFCCAMACLDHLLGGGSYAEKVRADPEFIPRLMTSAARQYVEAGILVSDYFPPLHELVNLNGGCLVVLTLVEASLRGEPYPSMRSLSQQGLVSASQVRHILQRATTHGLVTRSVDGQVNDAAALAAVFQQYVARELALYVKYALSLEGIFTGEGPGAAAAT